MQDHKKPKSKNGVKKSKKSKIVIKNRKVNRKAKQQVNSEEAHSVIEDETKKSEVVHDNNNVENSTNFTTLPFQSLTPVIDPENN